MIDMIDGQMKVSSMLLSNTCSIYTQLADTHTHTCQIQIQQATAGVPLQEEAEGVIDDQLTLLVSFNQE